MNSELNDEKIIQYLLGKLDAQERQRFEDAYFADDELYEQMNRIRDELIDDYVSGDMPQPQYEQFEKYFIASPQRRQKVGLAKALRQAAVPRKPIPTEPAFTQAPVIVSTPAESVSPWSSLRAFFSRPSIAIGSAVASALLIALSSIWLIYTLKLRAQLEQTEAKRQGLEQQLAKYPPVSPTPMPTPLVPPVEPDRPQRPEPGLVAMVLTSDYGKGTKGSSSEPEKLIIPRGTRRVRLHLNLTDDGFKSYRAVLQTLSGGEVWHSKRLKSQSIKSGKAVLVELPANRFAGQVKDYKLALSGLTTEGRFEDADSYSFQVVRK